MCAMMVMSSSVVPGSVPHTLAVFRPGTISLSIRYFTLTRLALAEQIAQHLAVLESRG